MSGYDLVRWALGGLSLIPTFLAARALYRRNPIGSSYLFGLFCLTTFAICTGLLAQWRSMLFWFLAFLVVAVLFGMLVWWRVRDTGRVVRGRVAILVWVAAGAVLHLLVLISRLHAGNPLGRFPELPPWAFGSCVGVIMLGAVLAGLQLRDAETYFT